VRRNEPMRCPTLLELPQPPAGRTGWPWTEETPQAPPTMPDGQTWPRVCIVTPSLNQGEFIEETIRSVLLQGCPNLEYIVIDGGSTDNSVEIIKNYEPWLTHWVSEPDRGQAYAINKGFRKSSGDILGWLNSDDRFLPGSLIKVATVVHEHPSVGAFVGGAYHRLSWTRDIPECRPKGLSFDDLIDWPSSHFCQPSCFFRRSAWESCGPLDEDLYIAFDLDLWLRMSQRYRFMPIAVVLSSPLAHPHAKTRARTFLMNVETGILQMRYGRQDLALKTLIPLADKCDALYPLPSGLYVERYSQLYHLLMWLKHIPIFGSLLKLLAKAWRERSASFANPA